MKRNLSIALLAMSVVLLASCSKEHDKKETMNVDTTSWTVTADYDYANSMTAVIDVEVANRATLTVDSADRMAAFAGEECLALASPTDSLFYLFIVPPQDADDQPSTDITLYYYSSDRQHIYSSTTTFPFSNGSQQGTAAEPLTVVFY